MTTTLEDLLEMINDARDMIEDIVDDHGGASLWDVHGYLCGAAAILVEVIDDNQS